MRYILVFTYIFILFSCQKDKGLKIDNDIEITDTIIIENPKSSSYMSYNNQLKDDTLIQLNYANTNSIDLFSLNDKNHVKNISFKSNGPQGVGNIQGFFYKNKDSIYLFNDTQVVLVDDEKQKQSIYDIKGDYDEIWYPLKISNGGMPYVDSNKIFFGKTDFEKMTSNRYYQADLLMSFDLATKEKMQYDIHFPSTYLDNCWQMNQADFSYTFNNKDDYLVFSFTANPNIFVFSYKTNKLKEVINLEYSFEPKPINCENVDDPTRSRVHYMTNPVFKYFVYDDYRDVYYRFIKKPLSDKDANKIKFDRKKPLYKSDYILQVFDQEFQPIAQQELKSPNFLVHDFFVAKDGLYISLNNPLKADFDENTLNYAKFNLKY
jgi:hypothetical protein